jgi:hypothetical protein
VTEPCSLNAENPSPYGHFSCTTEMPCMVARIRVSPVPPPEENDDASVVHREPFYAGYASLFDMACYTESVAQEALFCPSI